MAVKVVDASAVAALLFGEPDAGAVAGRLGAEPVTLDRALATGAAVPRP